MSAGLFTAFKTKSGGVLHFEQFGAGPPVLCLHGIGGGAYFFSGFAKRMAATHRVICVDLPGTGRSPSGVNPFTLDSMVADLGDFVREVIREPVILLGHSFGTILALKAWEAREMWAPGSIRAMIFVCGLPKARPNIHERLSARADDMRANASQGLAGWGPKVSPGVFSKKSMAEKPEVTSLFERLFEEQVPETYTHIIEVLLAADLNAVVPTVTVPCAAITGAEDSYAPPDAVREFVARLPVPCDVSVLEGCAHMPFYEAPGEFAGAAATILNGLDKST